MATTTTATGTDRVEPVTRSPRPLGGAVDPVLVPLLRSPLHWLVSDSLALVALTNRTTGDRETVAVRYHQDGTVLTVFASGTDWWRHLRGSGQIVEVVLRGERRTGYATVTEDDEAVAAAVRAFLREAGTGAAERVGLSVEGESVPDAETLVSAVDHLTVVRIDLNVR